jgi:hypothetical protein
MMCSPLSWVERQTDRAHPSQQDNQLGPGAAILGMAAPVLVGTAAAGCAGHSYARTSRTLIREALRAGSRLASDAKTIARASQSSMPLVENV